ncbi:MAG: response regulator transcription factor [Actinobacteria bacterium]|nr:response regulator transcription factor [Actinomycetota bacterium]MBV8394955.1 response regulator transcription factor [Actinomycetota bacterium]MBV8597766.1 response regulator transcription factor [Actinomycetota bacterium]
MARVRVVLVEDNQMFRQTLADLLALDAAIEVVASVANGREAVEVCGRLRPDVAVVDYRMPGLNGAEATVGVREASPETRVVCLTASVSRSELDEILAAGAVRCVMKDEGLAGIVEAIYAAAA